MPRRSNPFQRLVLLISRSLAGDARVVQSAMLADKDTGEQREVDVLISTAASGYEFNIAIEVVARGRRADVPWVEYIHSKSSSLPIDKVVLVSQSGFTSPALKKAKVYGFEALTIEEALATDWKMAIELTATGFFELTSFDYSCSLVYESSAEERHQVDVPPSAVITVGPNRTTLGQLVHHLLSQPETKDALYPHIDAKKRQFWFSFVPGVSLETEVAGTKVRVVEFRIGLDVRQTTTPIEQSTGKYKDMPFVSGVSTSLSEKLQFVVVKKHDGTTEGALLDARGIRPITGIREFTSGAGS